MRQIRKTFRHVFPYATPNKLILCALSYSLYCLVFGRVLALILMLTICVHENGHMWAAKRFGHGVEGFTYLPLMGGVATLDSVGKDRFEQYWIGIAGPVFGMACALTTFLFYRTTGSPVYLKGVLFISALHLFNFLPIFPLDGGRIVKAIVFSLSRKFGLVFVTLGTAALAVLFLRTLQPVILLLFFFGYKEVRRDFELEKMINERVASLTSPSGEAAATPDEVARIESYLEPTRMTTGQLLVGVPFYLLMVGSFFLLLRASI